MILPKQYQCQCKAVKKVTNHWWIALKGLSYNGMGIYPWSEFLANQPGAIHFCGQTCLAKFVSEWMNKLKEESKTSISDDPMPLPFSATARK